MTGVTKTTRAPAADDRFAVPLRGLSVDRETRCNHYCTRRDVVAIAFACCETYYPCFECHAATTNHEPARWPADRADEPAVLCGACRETLSVEAYLAADDACPACGAPFNPGCRHHRDRYFEPGC